MIILDATTRSLEIDLNGAVTTNQLPFVASYVDIAKTTQEVSSVATNAGASNSTTAVTLVAAPGANLVRKLSYLSVRNADTVATLLWIQLNDNSTLREIWKGTLAVGDTLVYVDALGWNVLDTNGRVKSGFGVTGPATSTDEALVRWDGTGGTALQNSAWTLTDAGVLTAGGNVSLGANYISRAGTAAGLSLDASNNATFSATLNAVKIVLTASDGAPLDMTGAYAGTSSILFVNSSNDAAAQARFFIQVGSGGGGATASDPHLAWGIQGVVNWSAGIDNSDSDKFKISNALGLGTNDYLTIDTSGNTTLSGTLTTSAPTGGAGAWELGVANAVSPTSPNRTITIEIGGTAYYIHAKTTND